MIARLSKFYRTHRSLILYGLIGASGALIDLILYVILYKNLHIAPGLASFLSVSLGIVNNFFLNRSFNFKTRDQLLWRFLNFYLVGLGGAVLSAILIAILYNGLEFNALIAKLLTILPVVLLQFFVNRRTTFQQGSETTHSKHPLQTLLASHLGLLIIILVFCSTSLMLVKLIPNGAPYGGPDEPTHYHYNVEFILKHHRLPVSGKDDIEALSFCSNPPSNHVPCLYSYQIYPQVSYLISAMTAWLLHAVIGLDLFKGARIASLLLGLVFMMFIYKTASLLGRDRTVSTMLTGAVVLVPQVIFIFSYVNQDAFSLAVASFAVYAVAALALMPNTKHAMLVGLACGGLIPLTKLNYWLLLPLFIGVGIYLYQKHIINRAVTTKVLLWSIAWFLILSAFWYIRNYILYHDFIGQSFVLHQMQHYHPLGIAHSVLSWLTLGQFMHLEFFRILFDSFFFAFGYSTILADQSVYTLIEAVLVAAVFYIGYINSKDTQANRSLVRTLSWSLAAYVLAAIGLVYFNSAQYDFQPQGRYLFSVLPVVTVFCALLYRQNSRYHVVVISLLYVAVFLFFIMVQDVGKSAAYLGGSGVH